MGLDARRSGIESQETIPSEAEAGAGRGFAADGTVKFRPGEIRENACAPEAVGQKREAGCVRGRAGGARPARAVVREIASGRGGGVRAFAAGPDSGLHPRGGIRGRRDSGAARHRAGGEARAGGDYARASSACGASHRFAEEPDRSGGGDLLVDSGGWSLGLAGVDAPLAPTGSRGHVEEPCEASQPGLERLNSREGMQVPKRRSRTRYEALIALQRAPEPHQNARSPARFAQTLPKHSLAAKG